MRINLLYLDHTNLTASDMVCDFYWGFYVLRGKIYFNTSLVFGVLSPKRIWQHAIFNCLSLSYECGKAETSF